MRAKKKKFICKYCGKPITPYIEWVHDKVEAEIACPNYPIAKPKEEP